MDEFFGITSKYHDVTETGDALYFLAEASALTGTALVATTLWMKGKEKEHPEFKNKLSEAIWWSCTRTSLWTVVQCAAIYYYAFFVSGYLKYRPWNSVWHVASDVADALVKWFVADFILYLFHRFLEHGAAGKYRLTKPFFDSHKIHHEFVYLNAEWCFMYVGTIEILASNAAFLSPFYLLPMWTSSTQAMTMVGVLFTLVGVIAHSDVDVSIFGVSLNEHHRNHHTNPGTNFAETFGIIDTIMGTKAKTSVPAEKQK